MKKWIVAGILVILAIAEWMREIHTFRVTRYQIHSPKLERFKQKRKIIMLSDLHNYSYGKKNQKLLKAIRSENPDMILIAGDMLVGKEGVSADVAEQFVGELPKICKTYYANGNHEHRMKENPEKYGAIFEDYKRRLLKKGVCFLENEKAEFCWDNIPITVYGLELPQEYYKKWERITLPVKEVEACIGKMKQDGYGILLAHNPAFVATYLKWGADLILSGHLHGGIVRIPHFRGVITPQLKIFPKYSGEFTKEGNQSVVVSKGLGTHTFKIRFLNPAEMIVLELGKEVQNER